MAEQGFVTVGDIAELLAGAQELLSGIEPSLDETIGHDEVRNWLAACRNLVDRLDGNRKALYSRVLEALGTASMCWDPQPEGVFQSEDSVTVADGLMAFIDAYADSLPALRPADMISRDEDDPVERLAAGIYEISTRIGVGMIERWSDAPGEIKRTLRETAAELLRVELIDPDKLSVVSEARRADDFELVNSMRAFEPNFQFPPRPHCLPGCDRLDGHDGRDPGACMRNGTVISTGLPPKIGMPAGFQPDELRRRELQLLEDQEANDTIGDVGRLRLAELRTQLEDRDG